MPVRREISRISSCEFESVYLREGCLKSVRQMPSILPAQFGCEVGGLHSHR